jgi:hypothetical protein
VQIVRFDQGFPQNIEIPRLQGNTNGLGDSKKKEGPEENSGKFRKSLTEGKIRHEI